MFRWIELFMMCRLVGVSSLGLVVMASAFGQESGRPAPRVPPEVKFAKGYVNPSPPPSDFKSALLWGIAIADTRVRGYESAVVEIASTQLSCRVGGRTYS